MAPSFFSWLGKGTSLRGLPVTLSGGPCASRDGVTSVVVDLDAVEDINADGVGRKAKLADAGLAVKKYACGQSLVAIIESSRKVYLAEP